MALLGTNYITLGDIAKKMDPQFKDVATTVELLAQDNGILELMPYYEGNLPIGDRVTVRGALPTVGTRRIGGGVATSKSVNKQFDESTMLIDAYSEVDVEAARIAGNIAKLRADEDMATFESMRQLVAQTMFYGNMGSNPDRYNGLATRYSATSGEFGNYILKAGGAGSDNTSIYLVGFGEQGVSGIYPQNTNAGIEREDMGKQTIVENGLRRPVYQTRITWHNGLRVKDGRRVVRIANIDVSDLATFGSGSDVSAKLLRLMIQATNKVYGGTQASGFRYAFLMNRTAKTWADIMQTEKANGAFGLTDINGKPFTSFRGIPCMQCDAITDAESTVS